MKRTQLPVSTFLLSLCSLISICGGEDTDHTHGTVAVLPGDEVWLISARGFDCDSPLSTELLCCQKFCAGRWVDATCDALHGNQQYDQETVVFVHGYQTDLKGARERGLQVYRNVFGNCSNSTVPIRFVIWAWKSEKDSRRPVQDFAEKSRRASGLGDVFALTLNQLGSKPPVVIAYSLGAQVVVSALSQSTIYRGQPIQLATIAAATDCGLSSGCSRLCNCGNIARSFIFVNSGDRAIRAARFACRITQKHPSESFENLAPMYSDQLGQINIVDITAVASHRHSISLYTELPIIQSCIRDLVSENGVRFAAAELDPLQKTPDPMASASRNESRWEIAVQNWADNVCTLR